MFKKNDIITLEITGMTSEGNGVGRHDSMAVFVPLSAIGDILKVRITKTQKNFAYGIIEEILTPSPDRIPSDCPVFSKCGGCSFRHISYEAELKIKENFVTDAFNRIGKLDVLFEPILGCTQQEYYRNKAQYPVTEIDGKAFCGFYSKRSHRVVPFTACKLQPKIFEDIVNHIIDYVNEYKIPAYNETNQNGLLRHIYIRKGFHSNQIMICFVVTRACEDKLLPLCKKLVSNFPDIKSIIINVNSKNTNVILGNKNYTLYGMDGISDIMCGNSINLSPMSFYQVNTAQAEKLYRIIANYSKLTGKEDLIDLYCGAGTIGLSLAKKAKKIIGIEIVEQAVVNASANAKNNDITNAEYICGDVSEITLDFVKRNNKVNIIIVDPPRKGCDDNTLNAIVEISPDKIIMVSCNPSTAARDCAFLIKNGYKFIKGQAVDFFPRTGHVETVVLMSRNI